MFETLIEDAMSNRDKTWVIILNWNQPEITSKCLDYVFGQRGVRITVLVVDNGSRSENCSALKTIIRGRCEILWLPRNLGFTNGMNSGIEHAAKSNADFVWLLNNDAFPEPDCLSRLFAALADDPTLAAVTPLLYGADGMEQHAGAEIHWERAEFKILFAADLAEPKPGSIWLTGTAPLFRVSALRSAGGFDERYFAYWEDVELCVRLGRAGYGFRAVPAARCLHLGSASTGGGGVDSPFSIYMMTRNGFRFYQDQPCRRGRAARLAAFAVRTLERAQDDYWAGNVHAAEARVAGVCAWVRGEIGPPSSTCQTGRGVRLATQGVSRLPRRIRGWLCTVTGWMGRRYAIRGVRS